MRSSRRSSIVIALFCAGTAATSIPAQGTGRPFTPAVVVEDVVPGSPLEQAGLRRGDLLSSWERGPAPPAGPQGAAGEIRTVFDWSWVKVEQAPRGPIRLHGERGGQAILIEVPQGPWDARVRPWMDAELLQAYEGARRHGERGDLEKGASLWPRRPDAPELQCWLLLQLSGLWSGGGRSAEAQSVLQTALEQAGDAQTRIVLWEALGESFQLANEMARAEASFRSALETGEAAWGESLQVAATLTRLGNVLRLRGQMAAAAQLHERALRLRQRLAPDSLEVADSLHHLFLMAWERRDPEAMAAYHQRASTLLERWPPGLEMADALADQALQEVDQGRYDEAARSLQRSLSIQERCAPESLAMARSLALLGGVTQFLGDAESAMVLLRRALAIRERLAPESLGVASILTYLGTIAQERGDLDLARDLFQRSLDIWEKAVPGGRGAAGCLNNLGSVARMRGDLDAAWSLHQRAREMFDRLSPGGQGIGQTLGFLGTVAEARGDLHLARDLHRQAWTILERRAPGGAEEILALHQLGRLTRRIGQPGEAAQLLARAIGTLESSIGRFAGSQDLQPAFRPLFEDLYRDAIGLALEQGETAAAFHLVERSRARSFLKLLAERDIPFAGELPAPLARALRENAARYDRTLGELARWSPAAGEEAREVLHQELGHLRRERDELSAEVREAAPRLAALRQPQPLDLAAARKVLDPGTLALSYSVGKDQTALFALTRAGGLRVEILKIGEERLRQDVNHFLERIQSQEAPVELARSLYRRLIGPVADLVEQSERVLILPDGPLHRLPFGALIRDTGRGQSLMEWKPLHSALSLTVYGTLHASEGAPSSSATTVVAFGDPLYPKAPGGETRDPILRSGGLRGVDWAALPYSRREVERIAEIYSGARLYLGEEATEEQAKAVGRDARVLHFSTHGYLDDRTPLDSALVLTIPNDLSPGKDNGLLQVWEIFESVRLNADLVVLSGCETALGRELSGEGLIGLTRAFQYAGARSVVASLWNVTDQITAELMVRFHRHLAAGLPKDEALRAAQIELIREPVRLTTADGQVLEMDASAPFFWAAFQLFGGWR